VDQPRKQNPTQCESATPLDLDKGIENMYRPSVYGWDATTKMEKRHKGVAKGWYTSMGSLLTHVAI